MPELEQKSFRRQVAYKIKISDILNGSLTKDDFSVSVRLDGFSVSRVNIIATVIYKAEEFNYAGAAIDDGTGKIQLRSFENNSYFSKIDVGDVVLVIGKIREFNSEKYIMPEILKKISNAKWMDVRRLELEESGVIDGYAKPVDEAPVSDKKDADVYSLVKKLDQGDGASFDDIVRGYGSSDAEKMLNALLESGDIFEIRPGRLKVLE